MAIYAARFIKKDTGRLYGVEERRVVLVLVSSILSGGGGGGCTRVFEAHDRCPGDRVEVDKVFGIYIRQCITRGLLQQTTPEPPSFRKWLAAFPARSSLGRPPPHSLECSIVRMEEEAE